MVVAISICSRSRSTINPFNKNYNFLDCDCFNVLVDIRALRTYEDYVMGLSSPKLYTSSFIFSHYDAYGQTRNEFQALIDEYKITKTRLYGNRATYVYVMHTGADEIKKTILIFVKSKDENDRRCSYNWCYYAGRTKQNWFLLGTPHLDTEYFPHTKMCSKTKVDYTMQKQIIICFVMGSVKSFKEDVKYTE